MANWEYIEGGADLLDLVMPLWRKLADHHANISVHFGQGFTDMKWTDRKSGLLGRARVGKLRVVLVKEAGCNSYVGYCVAAIDPIGNGDIESLFVEEAQRNCGIGSGLMQRILAWMDSHKVVSKTVSVAVGNEKTCAFYARYGFYPRTTVLMQKQ